MKNSFLLSIVFLMLCWGLQAQKPIRVGYVDMEYILQNVEEYQQASAQLDSRVQQWKSDIEASQKTVDDLKLKLENERALLTRELIAEREEDIAFEESKIIEYQQKRFGPNGDLFIQKRQLIQPIQDQVFNAVQEIGTSRNYDMIFDRTSDMGIIFSAERHNISDQVLRSINRASSRTQVTSKEDIDALEREEALTPEQDERITEREEAVKATQNEREAYIEERKRQRDSARTAKQREFEERRAKVLEERQRKKDSIDNLRKRGPVTTTPIDTNN